MEANERKQLREFIEARLREHNDMDEFADNESLFDSGRLDSLSVTQLVVYLEQSFGIDFGQVGFSTELVDSIDEMVSFVDSARSN